MPSVARASPRDPRSDSSESWPRPRSSSVSPPAPPATITSEVYNTLGVNDCPAHVRATITEDMVNEEYGALQTKLNSYQRATSHESERVLTYSENP